MQPSNLPPIRPCDLGVSKLEVCDETVHFVYEFNSSGYTKGVHRPAPAGFPPMAPALLLPRPAVVPLVRTMRKLIQLVILFRLLSPTPCFSQSQGPVTPESEFLTIDQGVAEALERNLGLLADRYNLTIADARIVTARLRPNPVLTLNADTLDLLGTGFNTQTNAGGPSNYGIRTDFLLERGGKRKARIAVAEDSRAVAQLQLLNTVRDIVLDVQNSFVDLQSAKDSLRLSQENLQTLHDIVDINEKRVKNGDLAEVELLRAQVAELQFENSVRQAELRVKTAKANFKYCWAA